MTLKSSKNPDKHHIFIAQADVQVTSNKELDMYEPIVKDINEYSYQHTLTQQYSSLSNNPNPLRIQAQKRVKNLNAEVRKPQMSRVKK
jgi:hypothetical protein